MKQGIIAFAFGSPNDIRSNLNLKDELCWLLNHNRDGEIKAVFTQSALVGNFFQGRNDVPAYCISQLSSTQHPPTLRIAEWAVKQAMNAGIDNLLILAAAPHLPRCIRDVKYAVEKLGAKGNIQVDYWGRVESYPSDSWFCQDCAQTRTRSRFNWWSREIILLCMPMWLYAKVAG